MGDKEFPHLHENSEGVSTPFNRFILAVRRVKPTANYEPKITCLSPYGVYQGRPIIGECNPVVGGILVGMEPQECVVVDERYGILERSYDRLLEDFSSERSAADSFPKSLLGHTIFYVTSLLRLDRDRVISMLERKKIQPDGKIALDAFIEEGVGAERHQILLAAYFIEKLRKDGHLSGFACIDGTVLPCDTVERLIYTSSRGDLFCFSPGQADEYRWSEAPRPDSRESWRF